ncbi:MAG: DUF5688 family protein [Lachnospiraceae bacterium]|nr:DUF5688 family protein [Lachnospiraceae bacterium]
MEYLNFCEKVKLKLQELVEEGATVRIQKVLKNNNVVRYAAIITERNSRISPSIYLENFYSDYINGRSLSDVCEEVLNLHNKHKDGVSFNFDDYFNYDYVKDKLYIKIINKSKNEEFLKGVPYKEFFDLAVICYISLEEAENGHATITVNNRNLEIWNVTKEHVFETAFNNSYENMPPTLEKMTTVMRDLLIEKSGSTYNDEVSEQIDNAIEIMEKNSDYDIYVLTNSIRLNGAHYITDEDYLVDFANSVNSDLYILPSSIHELLIIPMSCGLKKEELIKMVRDINSTELSQGEVLSDNIYEVYRDRGICMWECT